jgi:hypothetical protein
MMRLPARLAAKLLNVRITRTFRSVQRSGLLDFVNAAKVLHAGSAHPVSHEKIREIMSSQAPVIWIGGSEPLDHPGIAHLVRALSQSPHYIFLETNGSVLRRRIHEFQPLPRLFLTVRLDAVRAAHSVLAVEGLRAARLSGFFTVVHSRVREDSDFAEFARLRAWLSEKDLDGWLMTADATNPMLIARAAGARAMVPSAAWRRFSRLVEPELLAQEESKEVPGDARVETSQGEGCEEGVKVL